MKVLYDMVHPADVHFFRHAIAHLLGRGDSVLVTSRHKDITVELLDALRIPHRVISRRGRGVGGLLLELGLRDGRLIRAARAYAPDVVVANNSPSAAHVGYWLGVPSLVFDDTEIHRLNRLLYLPFATEVHSPDCFWLRLGDKHRLYPSYHALAYMHPARFRADAAVLRRCGVVPGRRTVVVRFVENTASHDFGIRGLTDAAKRYLVEALGAWAKVIVSAESGSRRQSVVADRRLPPDAVHHLLGSADLFLGDSATMCAEAAVLGVPAIYLDNRGRGYTDELARRYGLCFRFPTTALRDALAKAEAILRRRRPRAAFAEAHGRLLRDKIDPVRYQIAALDRLAGRAPATA